MVVVKEAQEIRARALQNAVIHHNRVDASVSAESRAKVMFTAAVFEAFIKNGRGAGERWEKEHD